jgi:hypothetical protein
MDHLRKAPLAIAVSFIERINRGDVEGLADLMAEDYVLTVFDEAPQPGRADGIEGWRGYATAFPRYIVYPTRLAESGERVAILGYTTGSHLGLPDEEEKKLTLFWLAEIRDGLVSKWTLIEDTPENRREHGLE